MPALLQEAKLDKAQNIMLHFHLCGGFFNVHLTTVLLDCGKIVIRRNDVSAVFLFFLVFLAQTLCRRHNKSESLFSFCEFVPHFISHGSQDCQHRLRVPFK